MGNIFSIILALIAGSLGSVQGTVNAAVSKTNGQYMMIAGVSLLQFVLSVGVLFFRKDYAPVQTGSMVWMGLSAVMGVVIMFSVAYTVGGIGTMLAFILVIAGQIVTSAVVSHFGWLGSPQVPISLPKIGSLLLIIVGVVCLVKSP
jgi:bacterial/archaeal transporter family-2 protein